jgi:hypothetical protein
MAENKVCTTMSDDPLSKLGNFVSHDPLILTDTAITGMDGN